MEPSSQMFTQGGIRTRDWFSERLPAGGGRRQGWETRESGEASGGVEGKGVCVGGGQVLPVESIAHLDGDQHGQGHGHGLRGLKDLTLHTLKVGIVLGALHEVSLQGEGRNWGPTEALGHPSAPRPPPSSLFSLPTSWL